MLRRTSGIILTMLLMGVLILVFSIPLAKAGSETITVPDDYPTIQEAINAANPRDTVYVRAGTYYEHMVVNKTVSIIGEDRNSTIIDGNRTGTVVYITADYVNISRLTVRNGYCVPHVTYGIKIHGCNNVTISDNIISQNDNGLFLYYSDSNVVEDNLIFDNWEGIGIAISNHNYVVNNTVFTNEEEGIGIGSNANSNVIHNNEIYNNSFCGIGVGWSTHNKIVGNTLSCNSEAGIRLDASNHNNIIGNHLAANRRDGIVLFGSNSNTVTGNTLIQNEWDGIALWYSNSNSIYHNNFLDNTKQAGSYSGSMNSWDYGYPSGGNYWSDYAGLDENSGPNQDQHGSDGLGDTPYVIHTDNRDRYPLMNPWSPLPVHNINAGLGYVAIQEAISASETLDGHTIFIEAGTYYENVIVNKTIALIGENRSTTIIDGGGTRHVISLMADNVNISGFTIRNSGSRYADDSGVHLVGHDHNNISGNMFTDTLVSIYLEHSHNNMISDNVIVATRQWYSIWLRYSHGNIIESNVVTNNRGTGIALWSSNANIVEGNNVTGISTLETANGDGISLYDGSHDNIVRNNILVDNRYSGICLMESEDNVIQGNVMKCNYLGIYSWKSNNIIIENTILKNDWHGICLYQSNGSIIYHNNFINNTISSWGINTWDNGYPSGGNYWSYYNGADLYSGPYQNETGSDGIGDTPYVIDWNNRDNYPLMNPWGDLEPLVDATSNQSVDQLGQCHDHAPEFPTWISILLTFTMLTVALTIYKRRLHTEH